MSTREELKATTCCMDWTSLSLLCSTDVVVLYRFETSHIRILVIEAASLHYSESHTVWPDIDQNPLEIRAD